MIQKKKHFAKKVGEFKVVLVQCKVNSQMAMIRKPPPGGRLKQKPLNDKNASFFFIYFLKNKKGLTSLHFCDII